MPFHDAVCDAVYEERDEARNLAWSYFWDLRQHVSDYEWDKHYAADLEETPWLQERLSALSPRELEIWKERR